jgi:hypothetical protein
VHYWRLLVLFALLSAGATAQWLNFPTPGTPRLPDGERVGDLGSVFQRAASGLLPRAARVSPSMLQHHEVDAVLFADVVKDADIRVIQAGDGAGLAFEAGADVAMYFGRTLTATVRSRRVSRAFHTSPIPPAPRGERIS